MDKNTITKKAIEYGISKTTAEELAKQYPDKVKVIDLKSTATKASNTIINSSNATATNYSKYTVGGNDSLRSQKFTRNEDLDSRDNFIARREQDIDDKQKYSFDPFTNKINEFRDKRRRKKKNE